MERCRPMSPTGEWRSSAACLDLDSELFFVDYGWVGRPPRSLKKEREAALAICEPCPVKAECLGYALGSGASHDFGVWGGTTRYQRVELRQSQSRSRLVLSGPVGSG